MIQHKTARRLMYEWHGGQYSAMYRAASSGLCESFSELAAECASMREPDRARLMGWIQQQSAAPKPVTVQGREYMALPWGKQ